MADIVVELLSKQHNRKSFDCGKEKFNNYIKTLARQHQEKRFSTTYVAVEEGNTTVLGYISISLGSVPLDEINEDIRGKLPLHPMPVLHVGRLATDKSVSGKGIGQLLLTKATDIAIEFSQSAGVHAIELEADDQEAFGYYIRRGFLPLNSEKKLLYAPVQTLIAAKM